MKKRIIALICIILAMLMVFSSLGCSNKSATINIAAKDFTEQYIIGEVLKAMVLEYTDLDVELTSGIAGETSIILPAMEKGEFDIYAEYDTTAWMTVLKRTKMSDIDAMHIELEKEYKNKYNLLWLGYYGFDNTYSIAVRKEMAEKYGLKTFSDLQKQSDKMVFGAGYEFFEREDGYEGLQTIYGFNFKKIREMNLSLKYNALLDKQVDAITIYRTDGRMSNPDIVELKDDKDYFPPALCGTIIRAEILKEHPELENVFKKLNGVISDEEMRKMNTAVDVDGRDPQKVAIEFLQKKGMVKNE